LLRNLVTVAPRVGWDFSERRWDENEIGRFNTAVVLSFCIAVAVFCIVVGSRRGDDAPAALWPQSLEDAPTEFARRRGGRASERG
jgi:hypothetical protein